MTNKFNSDEMLQEYTQIISHDLGSAMRGVSQLAAMLEEDIADRLNEKELHWMQLIKFSADRGQAMIDALAVYNRLVKVGEPVQYFNLAELVESCIASAVNSEQHKVQQQLSPVRIISEIATIELQTNKRHWQVLVQALIDNALRFCNREGQGIVRIGLAIRADQSVSFTVEDNGSGVDEAKYNSLTKLFSSTTEQADLDHLGVGLSYCARIAQLNESQLSFASSALGGLQVSYHYLQ